jgi:hypothetical protein
MAVPASSGRGCARRWGPPRSRRDTHTTLMIWTEMHRSCCDLYACSRGFVTYCPIRGVGSCGRSGRRSARRHRRHAAKASPTAGREESSGTSEPATSCNRVTDGADGRRAACLCVSPMHVVARHRARPISRQRQVMVRGTRNVRKEHEQVVVWNIDHHATCSHTRTVQSTGGNAAQITRVRARTHTKPCLPTGGWRVV